MGYRHPDHELDLWWTAGADRYVWKDVEQFAQRIAGGAIPAWLLPHLPDGWETAPITVR